TGAVQRETGRTSSPWSEGNLALVTAAFCVAATPRLSPFLPSLTNEKMASHLVLNAHPACDACR
ncbi:MAG: hypothetical protein L0Y58_19215, partial [Verrucomicrobia subdivision 3 bacterium]|nr:hypothetical protein [Limisphaerales bacterium]